MTPDDNEPPIEKNKTDGGNKDADKAEAPEAQQASSAQAPVEDEGDDANQDAGSVGGEDFGAAFKSAAQKVLEEKLGIRATPDGQVDFTAIDKDKVKDNAQQLITALLGNLAAGINKPAAPPSTDVPKKNAPSDTVPDESSNIIDLDRERQKREQERREPSELERRISMSVKSAFNEYMAQNFVPKDARGEIDLQLDAEMLKEHGPQLLATLFRSFTTAILPEDGVTVTVPVENDDIATQALPDEEESGDATDEAGETSEKSAGPVPVEVKLNIDVAGLFRGFLNPKDPEKS